MIARAHASFHHWQVEDVRPANVGRGTGCARGCTPFWARRTRGLPRGAYVATAAGDGDWDLAAALGSARAAAVGGGSRPSASRPRPGRSERVADAEDLGPTGTLRRP